MPIRKLRSVEEAEASTGLAPDDPALYATIAATWALADRLCPPAFPPGVYKHRDIASANRQREDWDRQTVARQSARTRPPR